MKPIKNEVNKLFEPGNLITAYQKGTGTPMIDYICIRIVRREKCPYIRRAGCSDACQASCLGLGEHVIGEVLDPITKEATNRYDNLCLGYNGANFEWRKYEEPGTRD